MSRSYVGDDLVWLERDQIGDPVGLPIYRRSVPFLGHVVSDPFELSQTPF